MTQKGFAAIIIFFGIVISILLTTGAFYIGRLTTPQPAPKPVVTSNTSQPSKTSTPIPTISASPTPSDELVFPSVCVPPRPGDICPKATRIAPEYKDLSGLINHAELIVVGHVINSCLIEALTIGSTNESQTPYLGHLIIDKSMKNPSKLERLPILTGTYTQYTQWDFGTNHPASNTCIILTPNRNYLLFLNKNKYAGGKYWVYDEPELEIQGSTIVNNPEHAFSKEIIQLGLDGLAEQVSKLAQ